MSLLSEAKKVKMQKSRDIDDEHVELAVAWAKDEVSGVQIMTALHIKGGSSLYLFLTNALRQYVRNENKVKP